MLGDASERYLLRLDLSPAKAAQLFCTTPVRRWLADEEVSGSAGQAVSVWRPLHNRRLPWRPNEAA